MASVWHPLTDPVARLVDAVPTFKHRNALKARCRGGGGGGWGLWPRVRL